MAEQIIFTGANLFDGDQVRQNMTVVVSGDRIVHVGETTPDGLKGRRLDLAGRTLMPGMTVGHWHGEFLEIGPPRFDSGPGDLFLGTEMPPALLAFAAGNALRQALSSGVTRVISGSCSNDLDAQLKMAIEQGFVVGPRITPTSRHVVTTGDHEDRLAWWRPGAEAIDGVRRVGHNVFADGPDQIAKAVRQEIARGAEIIKLVPGGGHGYAGLGRYRGLSQAELRVAVETAHERDARVRAHTSSREVVLECLRAGVDIIDHGDGIDEECIELMVQHNAFFLPSQMFTTLFFGPDGPDPEGTAEHDIAWRNMKEMLPKALAAGVKIVPGDDYGAMGLPHSPGIYQRELVLYSRQFGIAPIDVLRWATKNGAALALQEAESGTIEEGKLADLIVVNGDPVADLDILTQPDKYLDLVMVGGQAIKDRFASSGAVSQDPGPIYPGVAPLPQYEAAE